VRADPFHVSANTDSKGDRSRRPQDQDPDVLLLVVRETDTGIVVRGAKFETAAAYANQAFAKPTIGNWGDAKLSEYAVGFIADMGVPGLKVVCRADFAGRAPAVDYPLTSRFDEIDTLLIFDDVEIPWQNVLFYRHTRAESHIPATLHRYSIFPFVQRLLRIADMLVGTAALNVRQTGLMHLTRELCGGQLCVSPDAATFHSPETGPWMDKYYSIGERVDAEQRRRFLAFARDLLNSDVAGHRLTFELFAQSPPFAHLAAVYNNFDFDAPLDVVERSAGIAGRVASGADTELAGARQ
jgi:4-hydroxyphenylacetate 3-monooxygenase